MKIGICDDSLRDRELLKAALADTLCDYDTLECFEHGAAFLESHEVRPFDILFLDIGMPHLNGIDVATELRRTSQATHIIFVSQYRDYAAESYKVNAFNYLYKPIEKDSVLKVFQQARSNRLEESRSLAVRVDYEMVYLQTSMITYAETLRNKIRIHTCKGPYETRMTLRELTGRLDGCGFYRLHASYLVNLNCVQVVHNRMVVLDNGVEIPVGKTRRMKEVKASVLSCRRG